MINRKNISAMFPSSPVNPRSSDPATGILPAMRSVIFGFCQTSAEIASSLPTLELVILPAVGLFVLLTI